MPETLGPWRSRAGAKRVIGRPFPKGKSGNPGGRKPLPEDFREALIALTPKALRTIDEMMDHGSPQVRVVAAVNILDRRFGRPMQATTLSLVPPDQPPLILSDDDMRTATIKYEQSVRYGFYDDSGADGALLIEHQKDGT